MTEPAFRSESLVARAIARGRGNGLFLLVCAIYLLAFPWHPALRSPNELCRLWQARALVEHGKVSINEVMRDYGPVGDLSVKDGIYYPSKAPLLSFAAAPVYAVLRGTHARVPEVPQVFWSRLFLTVLPTLVMLVFLRRFLRSHLSPPVAEALTATYALGSLAFSYSLLFMSHQTTAVLAFGAFYALWRLSRGDWPLWLYWVPGAFAGATVAAEYTGAIAVGALLVYAAAGLLAGTAPPSQKVRRLATGAALAALGALPFIAFLMAYHQACFGHPLHSGYKYLADTAYQPWHLGGFLGIRTPDPRAFLLSFFSPLRGLFTLAPFLLLGVAGLVPLFRDRALRPIFWATAVACLGYAYFTSSFSYESWGWTTGPRHLTPLVPWLLLPAGLLIERVRASSFDEQRFGLGLSAGACAASVLVTGAVSLVDYIPDSVSSPLFGLAMPLFRLGDLPPAALSLLGLPNPWAGGPLLLGLLVAAAWVAHLVVRGERKLTRSELWPSALGAAVAASAFLALLAALTRHDGGDVGAVNHLHSAWSAPRGRAIDYWPGR